MNWGHSTNGSAGGLQPQDGRSIRPGSTSRVRFRPVISSERGGGALRLYW